PEPKASPLPTNCRRMCQFRMVVGRRFALDYQHIIRSHAMPKTIEHIHWPDAPDMWMPYAPAIKVRGGTTVYLAGVTAAPVDHHHPHRREEFDAMPREMEGQVRAATETLKRGREAVGANVGDDVAADSW